MGGVTEDGLGNLLLVAHNKIFCMKESGGTLSPCPSWSPTGEVSVPTAPATTSATGNAVQIMASNAPSSSRVYIHHGSSVVQCFDTVTRTPCSGWAATGVTIGTGDGETLVPVPKSGSGDGGICLLTHYGVVKGCVDTTGSTISTGILASHTTGLISGFRIPGTSMVLLPLHGVAGSSPPVACYDFSNGLAAACSWTQPLTPAGGTSYGFAMDPTLPDKCVLVLGHYNMMWRFDYVTGVVGCKNNESKTPSVQISQCSGKSEPAIAVWSSISITTPGATGTLTVSDGTHTYAFSAAATGALLAIPASFTPGAQLTFAYSPAAGTPAIVSLAVTYNSDKPAEICYQAKVEKCGAVTNNAVMKWYLPPKKWEVSKTVDLGKTVGAACEPPPPPSCLSGKAEVTCGKIPGTYNIIIHPNGVGGVKPTSVTITPITPGITLSPAQLNYPVVGGQVQVTVVGAHLGDVLEFDVSGTTAGGGSASGSDLCCNGKIKIEIPKDLPCKDLTPVDLAIKKTGGTSPAPDVPDYAFHLAITNEGPAYTAAIGMLTVTDVVPAGMKFTTVTPPAGWSCSPNTNVPAGTTITCHNTIAMNLPAGPGAAIGTINIAAVALGNMPFPDFTNCADVGLDPASGAADSVPPNNHSCVTVSKHPKDKKVEIEKTCEPAKLGFGGGVVGPKWEAICHIKVSTTGQIDTPIGVAEAFFGAGAVSYMSSTDPWTCSPAVVTSPTPMGCILPANTLNGPTNVSIIDVKVVLANAADGNGKLNCAQAKFETHEVGPSCVPIVVTQDDSKLTVIKEAYINGTHYTAQSFPTKVICDGNVVTTSIQDGAAPYVQTGLPIGASCTVTEGNNIAAPAGFCAPGLIASWAASYSIASSVVITAAGATVTVTNKLMCNPPPPTGTQTISKVCEPATEVVGAINHYEAKCHITVTTTGPQTGTLSVGENLTGNGTLGNATAPTPWTCSTSNCTVDSTQLNQTSSTSVIDVTVSFKNKGAVSETKNCAKLSLNGVADGESCTTFSVEQNQTNLKIEKSGLKDCKDNTPCPFTVTITSIGQPYNGNVLLYDVLTPNQLWPVTSIVPNVCGATISTMPFGCVANLNLAADTPFSFTVTLNPVTPGALEQNENCITVATVGSNVPTGPMSLPDLQNLAHAQGTGRPTQSCWPFVSTGDNGPKTGALTVVKNAIDYFGKHITTVNFPAKVTCGSVITPITVADGVPYVQTGIPLGTSCTVVEQFTNPPTGACPQGENTGWVTTYNPTTPVVITATGATITITNKVVCEGAVPRDMYVKKVVVNHAPLPLTGMVYDITSTCTNTTQPTGFAHFVDGQTTIFHHYEPGMSCTLSEAIPATTACGNDTPVWTTTYSQPNPVVLSPNGETVVVTNTLDCKKSDTGWVDITKKFDDQTPKGVGNVAFDIAYDCGQGPNTVSLHSGETSHVAPLPLGNFCTVTERPIGKEIQTAAEAACGPGATPVWTTTYVPEQKVTVAPGASVTVVNTVTCKGQDIIGVDIIKKVVAPKGIDVGGLTFSIGYDCGHGQQGTNPLGDGQSAQTQGSVAGVTCHIQENPFTANPCGKGQTPHWSTAYAPSQDVVAAAGASVTVTNSVTCETVPPVDGNPIKVKKVVINNAPAPVGDLQFPITVTCVKGSNGDVLDNDVAHTVADGQTVDFEAYAAGFSCSAHEGAIPQTNACGKDTPVWTTTYATQPVAMTPAGETITVTNMLNCTQPVNSGPTCGNGVIEAPEQCDDGGIASGNGCSSVCKVEPGYHCAGQPSVCDTITPPPPVLKCDTSTTKLVGCQCCCIIQGMVPDSKTSCDCPDGMSLKGGVCRKDPPPPLVCKGNTHLDHATNRCVQNELICPPKTHKVGNHCVADIPDCPPHTRWNGRRCQAEIPNCPRGTKWDGRRCVEKQQPLNCPDGMIKLGRVCIPMARHCPFGTIPTPLGCIGIGGGGGGRPPPRTDGGAVPGL